MKVLIVDDESTVRRSLVRVAQKKGAEVFQASDGIEAIEVWKSCKPDLVFLDVLMPGKSGPEVLSEVKNITNAKVVLISAFSGEYNMEKALALGADLFISKPFENIFESFDQAWELLGNT